MARLRAVKEQLLIRYLGCGWVEAHHPWSRNGDTYISSYLFKFLKETVIPLEQKKGRIPDEALVKMPSPPEMKKMGMTLELALRFKSADKGELDRVKREGRHERDDREAEG